MSLSALLSLATPGSEHTEGFPYLSVDKTRTRNAQLSISLYHQVLQVKSPINTSSKRILLPFSSGVPPIRFYGTRQELTCPNVPANSMADSYECASRPEAAECRFSRFQGSHAVGVSSMSVVPRNRREMRSSLPTQGVRASMSVSVCTLVITDRSNHNSTVRRHPKQCWDLCTLRAASFFPSRSLERLFVHYFLTTTTPTLFLRLMVLVKTNRNVTARTSHLSLY